MQIILIKSVRKLGKVGEIVNVKAGYGRNFLVPRELAIRATKENIAKFSSMQSELESKNDNNKVEMTAAAKSLEGQHFTFVTQSGADGRLFGSISLKLLASAVSKVIDHKLSYSNILLDTPIKFNGTYEVQVMLHPEVLATILVVVAKSESEAQDALYAYKVAKRQEVEGQAEASFDGSRQAEGYGAADKTQQDLSDKALSQEIDKSSSHSFTSIENELKEK